MAVADSSGGDIVATPPPPGTSSVVQAVDGDGVFKSPGGKTCHQCRQTIKNSAAVCTNQKKNKPCLIKVCDRCLLNRYGDKAEVIAVLGEWKCPKCRGICNCSICRKKTGHQPTGPILSAAKANGFSSVSEFLDKGTAMFDTLKKENSFEGKVDANVPESERAVNGIADDGVSSIKSKIGQKRQRKDGSDPCEKKPKKTKHCEEGEMDNAEPHPEITTLPVGAVLTNVAGIDFRAEDIGDALQFLEFCSVFGKVLEIRKGQPEHVLQDLFHGRTARRGKYSMTVQFHMQLLSVLKPEDIQESESSDNENPLHERDFWFQTLKECLTRKRKKVLKRLPVLDSLKNAADYDTLDPLIKLKVLNYLCDEILQTDKVRCWIDPDSKDAAKFKEAEQQALQDSSMKKTRKGTKKSNIPEDDNSMQNSEQATQECSLKKAKNGTEEVNIPEDGNSLQHSEQASQECSLKKAKNGTEEVNIPEDGNSMQHSEQASQECSLKKAKNGIAEANIPEDGNSMQHSEQASQECSLKETENGTEEANIPEDGNSMQNSEQATQECSLKKAKNGTEEVNIPEDGNSMQNSEQATQECSLKKSKNGTEEANIPENGDSVKNSEQATKESSLMKKEENGTEEDNIPKDGSSLQNFVQLEGSSAKSEAAQDHVVAPESKDMLLNSVPTFLSIKTDPVFVDNRGHAFWKLNCLGKSDILDQYIGEGCDCIPMDENWSVLDAEGKDVIEKHAISLQNNKKEIEKLRRKMKRRAQGGV